MSIQYGISPSVMDKPKTNTSLHALDLFYSKFGPTAKSVAQDKFSAGMVPVLDKQILRHMVFT